MSKSHDATYRAAEFAALAGVTVRALRHYERLGLLRPRRTAAGYRVYTDRDLQVLEQIVVLKFIGVRLKQIPLVRTEAPADLAHVFFRQRQTLEARRRLLSSTIEAIATAEQSVRMTGRADATLFKRIIEVIEMRQNHENWREQAYELIEQKRVRLSAMSSDERDALRQRWLVLFADIRAALDDDPAGPRGQALAARYIELGRQMADTTDEKLAGHVTAKPASFDPDTLLEELSDEQRAKIKRALAPFSDPRERDFIRRALAARSETR
jgi:DNA-binding transcriptional MerR regulator